MAQALPATPAPAPDERFYDPRVYVDQITDILTDRRVESSKVAQAEKVESAPSAGADRTLVASAGSTTSEAPIPALEIVPVEAELLGDGDYIPLTPVPSERDAATSTGLTDAGVSGPRSAPVAPTSTPSVDTLPSPPPKPSPSEKQPTHAP